MNPIVNLQGKVGLITGIANEKSISTGVAEACAQAGAKLVITYQNDKTRAFIEPIIQRLGVEDVLLLDVTQPGNHGRGVRRDRSAPWQARLRGA